MTLVRIECDGAAPFTAGFVIADGVVIRSAPILYRHLRGKDRAAAWEAIKRNRSWRVAGVVKL